MGGGWAGCAPSDGNAARGLPHLNATPHLYPTLQAKAVAAPAVPPTAGAAPAAPAMAAVPRPPVAPVAAALSPSKRAASAHNVLEAMQPTAAPAACAP